MANKTTRPITMNEYETILNLITNGFDYEVDGTVKTFKRNSQLKLALILESNIGLRISDIKELSNNNFKNGKLEITEKKTGKLQYRNVNSTIYNYVKEYVIENNLKPNDKLIKVSDRAIQKQLKIVCDYLGLNNVSTHSFRKLYATKQYEKSNNNIELVKELLNHSNISITQKYIRVSQQAIDKASEEFCLI